MRIPIVSAAVITVLAIGCAHVSKEGFDLTTNTITMCGNKWANLDDITRGANKECGGKATLLRCGTEYAGSFSTGYTDQ